MSNWIDRLQKLERLDSLIRRKATGDRQALARRMSISVRTLTNLMNDLRMLGAEIDYDRERMTYTYCNRISSDWEIFKLEDHFKVGDKFSGDDFPLRQNYCPD